MGKLLVVTGGTKGIGRSIAYKFASQGFDVITCARNQNDLNQLQQDLQSKFKIKAFVIPADLSQKAARDNFIEFVKTNTKAVDVLVNNTGFFIPGQINSEEDGVLEQMIETNLYSAYHITRGLIKEMIARKSGHIFTICSTASITPYTNGGSYCVSKYALYGMTKVLREEMKEHTIKVTAVLPGATLTASWEGVDLPPERFMKAEDVAEMIFATYSLSPSAVVEDILIRPMLGDLS